MTLFALILRHFKGMKAECAQIEEEMNLHFMVLDERSKLKVTK